MRVDALRKSDFCENTEKKNWEKIFFSPNPLKLPSINLP